MRVQGIADINRVGNVEELPAICRLHSIIATQIEGIDRSGSVGLRVGIGGNDTECLLPRVVRLQSISPTIASPGYLHGIVVSIQIVCGSVEVTVSKCFCGIAWIGYVQWPI